MRPETLAAACGALTLAGAAVVARQGTLPEQPPASAVQPGPPGETVAPPYWSMLSRAERDTHRQQMLGARTAGECRRIREDYLKRMDERAMARGMVGIPRPRHDECAAFRS